ncbi:cell division protein CrgA [Brachybacterium sp. FME24]|uniref:cell division protein CrgA n=1 Tax=Brachybacterium sp. FME24 TaxID=2742605 RepID=UPI001867CA58|nr:cell division protein CrgA [Brachybacterium sp. FME24]
MARSKKKSSARAASTAKAPAIAPETEDLDDPTTDRADGAEGATGAEAVDTAETATDADESAKDDAQGSASGKDPVKKSRPAGAKDPVAKKSTGPKAGKGKGADQGTPTEKTAGSEVTEKAKDATRSTSPKKAAAAESARTGRRRVAAEAPNPAWLAPAAVAFLILGLLYLVTFYLSGGTLPLPIGDWNLAAGFGVMLVGGGMLMFWK